MTVGQLLLLLASVLIAGAGTGAYLLRVVTGQRIHRTRVRWQRQLQEVRAEYEHEIAQLTKTLILATEKQESLLETLRESEETVTVLSAKRVPAYENDIAERNARIAALEKSLAHQRARAADAEDHEQTLERRMQALQHQLRDQHEIAADDPGLGSLQPTNLPSQDDPTVENTAAADRLQTQSIVGDFLEQMEELRTGLLGHEQHESDLAENSQRRDAQIDLLRREFDQLRSRLPALDDALRERESSIEDLIKEISRERQRATLLEQRLANIQAKQTEPSRLGRPTAKIINIQEHLENDPSRLAADEVEKRIRMLEQELDTWKRRRSGHGDDRDLQRINGIGPVMEAELNALGIYRLDQVANLTRADIKDLGRHNRTLPGRLRRFKWIEQARRLSPQSFDPRDSHHPGI